MLKYQVENLDGVDATLHSFYEETDNGFKLKVDGVEDVGGLKSALEKERNNNKEAKTRLSQLEKDREEAEKKVLEEQGKFKDLSERERNEKLQAQKELNELKTKIANAKSESIVKDLALSMTTDKDEIDIVSRFARDYIAIEGEDVTFNKSVEDVKAELARFVKSKATDGIDRGNTKTGGNAKTISREDFMAKTPNEQMSFIKSGGLIK